MKNGKTRIACAGSSNTDGWPGTLNYTPYSYFLQFQLGASYEVMNFGKFNTTATFSMDDPYVMNVQYRSLMMSEPDIVVLKLGGNDSKDYNWNAHGQDFRKDYSVLVDRILNLETKPVLILCTPTRYFPDNPFEVLLEEIVPDEIIPQISEVAEERNLKLLDFYNLLKDLSYYDKDHVHLNNKGHEAAAGIVFEAIRSL